MFEELKKWLIVKHQPTQQEPWEEWEYPTNGKVHEFAQLVDRFVSISTLSMKRVPFFFRGQAKSSKDWPLEPLFCRLVKGIKEDEALRLEYDAIQYFKKHAKIFIRSEMIPKDNDIGDWIALMQHYRTPTRMLDWSASCNVALYFAVFDEPQEKPGALWFFWWKELSKIMGNKFGRATTVEEWNNLLSDQDKFVKFGAEAKLRINMYESDVKSERMMAQKGVSTFCERLYCDHAQVIGEALMHTETPLCKIVINPQEKMKIREYLNKLNITAVTLFPGIDGFGGSIKEIITVYRDKYCPVKLK
jgi:hypothetical protein